MKDLVDHVRTIHFTVFLVALILTIALRGHTKAGLERAASDAEAILLLSQRWPQVEDGFAETADKTMKHGFVLMTTGLESIPSEPGFHELRPASSSAPQTIVFQVRKPWIYADGSEPDENPGWGESEEQLDKLPKRWTTLSEFLKFWDDHLSGARAFLPVVLMTKAGGQYCHGVGPVVRADNRLQINGFLVPETQFKEGHWMLSASLETFGNDPNRHQHFCDFASVQVPQMLIDLGAIFSAITPQAKNWGKGKASDEFNELLAEAKYLEDCPVKQLAGALRERANSNTESIELFQAKVPVEQVATYGALVLIACQIYFLAHLLELRRLARTEPRVNWPSGYIGLYENHFIFMFTFISTALWPPLPLLLVARARGIGDKSRYSTSVALAISIALSMAASTTLLLIRRAGSSKTPKQQGDASAKRAD